MHEITIEKLQILYLIDKLSKESGYGIAHIQKVIDIITEDRNIRSLSVRKQVSDCKKKGLIENPLWGGWKLTDKGKKVLAETSEK